MLLVLLTFMLRKEFSDIYRVLWILVSSYKATVLLLLLLPTLMQIGRVVLTLVILLLDMLFFLGRILFPDVRKGNLRCLNPPLNLNNRSLHTPLQKLFGSSNFLLTLANFFAVLWSYIVIMSLLLISLLIQFITIAANILMWIIILFAQWLPREVRLFDVFLLSLGLVISLLRAYLLTCLLSIVPIYPSFHPVMIEGVY